MNIVGRRADYRADMTGRQGGPSVNMAAGI